MFEELVLSRAPKLLKQSADEVLPREVRARPQATLRSEGVTQTNQGAYNSHGLRFRRDNRSRLLSRNPPSLVGVHWDRRDGTGVPMVREKAGNLLRPCAGASLAESFNSFRSRLPRWFDCPIGSKCLKSSHSEDSKPPRVVTSPIVSLPMSAQYYAEVRGQTCLGAMSCMILSKSAICSTLRESKAHSMMALSP